MDYMLISCFIASAIYKNNTILKSFYPKYKYYATSHTRTIPTINEPAMIHSLYPGGNWSTVKIILQEYPFYMS